MTNNFKLIERISEGIDSAKHTGTILYEAKVLKVEEKSNKLLIQLLPNGSKKGIWCKMSYENASNNSMIGTMPQVNSLIVVADLTTREQIAFSNLVYLRNLFTKENVKPSKESDNTSDKHYITLNHKNGDKIEIYEGDDGKRIKIKSGGIVNITVEGEVNIDCPKVRLGNVTDDNTEPVVLAPHLEKFNEVCDALIGLMDTMNSTFYIDGIIGPMPLTVLNSALSAVIVGLIPQVQNARDSINKSTKTRVDK